MSKWGLEPTGHFESRLKKYSKSNAREVRGMLQNLEKYRLALEDGLTPTQMRAGFIHAEPRGIIAIDPRGAGDNLAPTRLYIYPKANTIFLLTIGDKGSQSSDIDYCRKVIKTLRSE